MSSQPDTTSPGNSSLRVWVALGANLDSPVGAPDQTVRQAQAKLKTWSVNEFAASSLYRTSPENCPVGTADFINAVVRLGLPARTDSEELLDRLLAMEAEFGRQRTGQANESRTLDADLIMVGERIQQSAKLVLPHPRAHRRRFVLQPLAELDSRLVLPGQHKSVAQLLRELPEDGVCRIIRN